MKNLQDLLTHPSVQGASALKLMSGKPVILIRGNEKKGLGQPLSSQHLFGLLKASFSQEVIANFKWGAEFDEVLVADRGYPIHLALNADKTIVVDVQLEDQEEEEGPVALELSTPPPHPATMDPEPAYNQIPVPEKPKPTPPPPSPQPSSTAANDSDEIPEELLDELTQGDNLGLIYYKDRSYLSDIEQSVGDFGYDPKRTDRGDAVTEVLKYQEYGLFVMQLDENFLQDPTYQSLIHSTMDRRRTQYSVLIAPGMKTGDSLQAFCLSVHMVVSPNDTALMYDHIEKEIKNWKRFVGTFHEFLDAAGKL